MSLLNIARAAKRFTGFDTRKLAKSALEASVRAAAREQGLEEMIGRLEQAIPDISQQYNTSVITNPFETVKVRAQHAFQMRMVTRAISMIGKSRMTVADIGDSSGNHLTYIKKLMPEVQFRTISVDLNPVAVEKVRAKGMEAICCAAEDLDLGDEPIDLFMSFEMVEHLMNPCQFFRRMAVKGKSDYLFVSVPYRETSRVALHTYSAMRDAVQSNASDLDRFLEMLPKSQPAEDEHIFELSPLDWKMLMLFSGWRPLLDEVYLQYPQYSPYRLTKGIWREVDYEGFWAVFLKRDLRFSNIYQDWRD